MVFGKHFYFLVPPFHLILEMVGSTDCNCEFFVFLCHLSLWKERWFYISLYTVFSCVVSCHSILNTFCQNNVYGRRPLYKLAGESLSNPKEERQDLKPTYTVVKPWNYIVTWHVEHKNTFPHKLTFVKRWVQYFESHNPHKMTRLTIIIWVQSNIIWKDKKSCKIRS